MLGSNTKQVMLVSQLTLVNTYEYYKKIKNKVS